jgi:hypothetical protein
MPSYDAFGRPLDGTSTAERARSVPRGVFVAAALVALALAGAAVAPHLHADRPAAKHTARPRRVSQVLGATSLLRPINLGKALSTGADLGGHGALIGVDVTPRVVNLQFAPVDGIERDVLVYAGGRTYTSRFKATDYGHHFSVVLVNTSAPQRFVPAAAREVHVPVDALKSLLLLAERDGTLMWFATFTGYHGDVRGSASGTVLGAHPYP